MPPPEKKEITMKKKISAIAAFVLPLLFASGAGAQVITWTQNAQIPYGTL
jgi:hypothetical protein